MMPGAALVVVVHIIIISTYHATFTYVQHEHATESCLTRTPIEPGLGLEA